MTYIDQQKSVALQIYGNKSWREGRRRFLFVLRSIKNKKQVDGYNQFFKAYQAIPNFYEDHIELQENINRIFFYANSTAQERLDRLIWHFEALPKYLTSQAMVTVYNTGKTEGGDLAIVQSQKGLLVWESKELAMQVRLLYLAGQRKEGLMSLLLTLDGQGLYHINFSFEKNPNTGEIFIHVGTIQGYQDGLDNAKKATKEMFGYRPKNFIFYVLRQLAAIWGIQRIEAVSDEGFYTNTHLIRGKRHKLTEFNSFWEELGGKPLADKRFYQIPVEEERKDIEEIKSKKRSQYRKRYAFLDQVAEDVQETMAAYVSK